MKKIILLLFVIISININSFAQNQSIEIRNLQGTWALIGIMDDSESYNEKDIIAEKLEIYYIFSNNTITIRKPDEDIGPVNYTIEDAYIKMGSGNNIYLMPYNLQGNILIIHEGGYAFIYRKR